MLKISRCLLLYLLLIPLAAHASYSPGQLLIRLKSVPSGTLDGAVQTTGIASIDAMLVTNQMTAVATLKEFTEMFRELDPLVTLTFSPDLDLDSLENALAGDSHVEWVTRNYHYRSNNRVTPNDSLFSSQWWLEQISAPLRSHGISRGGIRASSLG